MSFCPKCGKEQVSDAQFCGGCGTALGAASGGAGTSAPKKKVWIYALVAVSAVVVLAVVLRVAYLGIAYIAYLFTPMPVDEDALALKHIEDSLRLASEAATKVGTMTDDAPMEIIVNIDGSDEHFLKAAIIFEYDEKNVKLGEELRRRAPRYKDMLIKHMSSLSYKEISDPSERDKICKDLRRMINASLPQKMGEVQGVLFKTYLIQ